MIAINLLYSHIKKKGYTLEEFAQEIGMNPATLYRKTRGESDFTRMEMQKIKEVLELSVEEFNAIFFPN